MTHSNVNFQVGISLSSLLVLLFYASFQNTVFACDAPQDGNPMVIGVTGDKFIAIYNVSGTMCVFEQPASGVTDGKAYLGKSGKEVKEAWPELELPPSVFAAVLVTDSKGGHFILFQVTPPTTPPPRHKKKRAVATAKTSLGDGPPSGNIVFDVDNKKVVSKDATPYIEPMYISSKEPMTMYRAMIGNQSNPIYKLSFEGDSLPKSNTKESDTHYDLCPSNEKDNQLVATATKKGPLCKKKLPNFPENVQATGFADDKNFHLMANGKVISFEKDAIGDKLGKPVPFTITESKDFFVKEDAPGGGGDGGGGKSGKGGGGSTWLVVIIIIIVIVLIIAAVAIFCCFSMNKKGSRGAGKGGGSGKGGGGKSKKKGSKMSKKSKMKKSSSKLRSSRKSSKKLGSKKSSKKGGPSRLSSRGKRSSVSKAAATSRNVSSRKVSSAKPSSKKSSKR